MYIGRSGGIRTRDPLLPKQMRYQAALRSDNLYSTATNNLFLVASVFFRSFFTSHACLTT